MILWALDMVGMVVLVVTSELSLGVDVHEWYMHSINSFLGSLIVLLTRDAYLRREGSDE